MTKLTSTADQQFLDDLDKKLWNAADRLHLVAMNMAIRGIDFNIGNNPPTPSALQHQRMVGQETYGET